MLLSLQALFLISGAMFFVIGSLGLLRFPDTASRLHALTKVDNLGLGLLVCGLLLGTEQGIWALKLLLIWLLTIAASALAGHLVLNQTPHHPPSPRSGEDHD
ncbi:monovalent cation/H(+) antiporter subunit G [Marinospirillum sp. MEB164]|uniref:Monovalent cation/H(+) antiporter subunit G n=1 Tax=Marinospirillum alkalitolerans TaxID=3123374 RepID=A0ABW8PXP2_9GAMM